MSTIAKTIHILTTAAGTSTAKVIYEVQTSDKTPKRILVARVSTADPYLYFQDHDELKELGILSDSVINLYEDEWPEDLTPQLSSNGALPDGYNTMYTQADFGVGKSGTLEFNSYDRLTGSFKDVTRVVSASANSVTDTAEKWYQKSLVKVGLYAGLVVAAVFGIYKLLTSDKK